MRKTLLRITAILLVAVMLVPMCVIESGAAVTYMRKLGVPIDYQFNYKTVRYGTNKSTSSSGCGAASASMVVEYFTGNTSQSPDTLFKWACDNGWYTGSGLSYAAVKKLCSNYNVNLTWVGTKSEITNALKAGNPVIALMGPGTFTSGGHYIVLTGIKIDGGTTYIMVNDPNSSSRTGNYYTLDLIWSEKRTSSSTPFGVCTYSTAPKRKVNDYYAEPGHYSQVKSSDGSLNMRASASSSGTLICAIPTGTYVYVNSISGNWANVTYNGKTGYVNIPYIVDAGDPSVGKPTLSVATTVAHGASLPVSWSAVSGATSYKYTAKLYNGEKSATSAITISSGSTTSTSFTVPAQSTGKYMDISVTATDGTTSATATTTVMVGPYAGYPADVQYIPINSINDTSYTSASCTVITSKTTAAFTRQYWRAFTCTPNADGTYTVSTIHEYNTAKSVTVSGSNILVALHCDATNYEYAANIVTGDKLSLVGVYLDNNTIRGSGHILVNGGIPIGPEALTVKTGSKVKLKNNVYTGNAPGTTVSGIVTSFNEAAEYITVKNAAGAVVTSGKICTGYTVSLIVSGNVVESHTLAVTGDVDGDGEVSTVDLLNIASTITSKSTLSGAYFEAGDLDSSGNVDGTDYLGIKIMLRK